MAVGFIGAGIMGAPMAGHLLDGGHEVKAFGIVAVGESSTEIAEWAEVVIVVVPDAPHSIRRWCGLSRCWVITQ